MKYDPEAAYRRELEHMARLKASLRASYESDPKIRCIRARMLQDLEHGDALMTFYKLPTQPVVDAIRRIGGVR